MQQCDEKYKHGAKNQTPFNKTLARFAGSFFQILMMEVSGQRTMHDLRIEVYQHIQKLPMSFFTVNTVGRLSTRVTNDIQNMQEMFTTIITFVMSDMFTLVGACYPRVHGFQARRRRHGRFARCCLDHHGLFRQITGLELTKKANAILNINPSH
jgi:hypothetical protein